MFKKAIIGEAPPDTRVKREDRGNLKIVVYKGDRVDEDVNPLLFRSGPIRLSPRDLRRIELAIAYIREHFRARISQEGLSMEVKISILKLQAGLRFMTGYSLYGYQEQVRIGAASEMLSSTQLSLSVIGRNVGLKTHSHFGEVFKRVTGLTPSEYRNRYGC